FWLRRWQPWTALALGLIVFSPVIFWNAHHDWASFAYQSARTVAQKGHWSAKLADFWGLQLAVLTPVGLAVFAIAAVRGIRGGWMAGIGDTGRSNPTRARQRNRPRTVHHRRR